ncbi:MAG: DMT family transporter [Treponema sp.]|jgi:drug/metabolite transporter (DMT)-like permease|nr:DMT family transporter [Treponema sp.]
MNKRTLRADALLLLTSCIWGFGFVAQRAGMEYVGPFTYNGVRFLLGSLSLLPLIFFRRGNLTGDGGKTWLFSSLAAGSCLFVAVTLQQLGMMVTTAGNAGFITGLYVVLTPVLGLFLGKKTGPLTWIGAAFTLAGLYFLSSAGNFNSINLGDVIIAVSAIFWAVHVLLIDALVRFNDPVRLSSGQFAWCGLCALILAFTAEPAIGKWAERFFAGSAAIAGSPGLFAWRSLPELIAGLGEGASAGVLRGAAIPILYGGLGSVGVAYTLQAVAQRDSPPAHATIILCLEGSFAALGGALFLGERLGVRTLTGFLLMFSGMILTQWDVFAARSDSMGGAGLRRGDLRRYGRRREPRREPR